MSRDPGATGKARQEQVGGGSGEQKTGLGCKLGRANSLHPWHSSCGSPVARKWMVGMRQTSCMGSASTK